MSYYPEYKTNWVKELPQGTCPACESAEVEDNSFTDKKGNHWDSVKCEGCRTKWIKSKGFGAKESEARRPKSTRDLVLLEEIQALNKKMEDFELGFAEKMANLKKILVIISEKIDDKRPN